MRHLSNLFTDLFGFIPRKVNTKQKLKNVIRKAASTNLVDSSTLSMIESALAFPDLTVQELMIPRKKAICINVDANISAVKAIIKQHLHSRYPVLNNKDEVIGVLLTKDLIFNDLLQDDKFTLENYIRSNISINSNSRADNMLKQFKDYKEHMAIVLDNENTFIGIITIEDVLEQIVGDIEDEFGNTYANYITKYDDNNYVASSITTIGQFNSYFETVLDTDDSKTLGDLVIELFGELPEENASINYHGFTFTVMLVGANNIKLLKIIRY